MNCAGNCGGHRGRNRRDSLLPAKTQDHKKAEPFGSWSSQGEDRDFFC
jgi:hypothetical protein